MPRFKITIAYDGTGLVGWQRQAIGTSVQGLLEESFAPLEGEAVEVAGAGRTDAGVHALGQVAHVTLKRSIDPATLVAAVNVRLPPAVRVLSAEEVDPSFHARFDSSRKCYRYRIWNGAVISPFERLYAWHVPEPVLDVDAMHAAAQLLEGEHDFAAFQTVGATTHTTRRRVFESVVRCDEGPMILYEVTGGGFLRHMVRSIVGTLVEVGRGRRPPDWIREVVSTGDRRAAGRTAPAEGLFLVRVEYTTHTPSA